MRNRKVSAYRMFNYKHLHDLQINTQSKEKGKGFR